MTFDAFLHCAWAEHGNRPQEVADRLASSLNVVQAPEHVPQFAALLTHVYGEHLGRWYEGIDLLESLRSLPVSDGGGPAGDAIHRNIATLHYAAGDSAALESLSIDDQVFVLATASSAFAGRQEFKQAIAAYFQALQLAREVVPSKLPARALATGGNNLAASLEQKQDRDRPETQAMRAAAEGGLKYWKLAGTWLEEQRAEYRLTRSLLQTGDASAAVDSARRCMEICKLNHASAFDQFFGYAVLALAERAAGDIVSFEAARIHAMSLFEQVPQEERQWCEPDLGELRR